MVYVIAVITAKPGKREEFLQAYREVVPQVRLEPGCLEYGPLIDLAESDLGTKYGPDTFVVIGKWDSFENQKAHAALRPHMVAFREKTSSLLDHREIHVLSPVI
jgi:quinol monooxygenase YgiN